MAQALFVGRASALAALSDAFEQTCQGDGGLALVAGEPGIGKTTLVNELATSARRLGGTVLWGNCWEGEGTPAFWPWIDLVRSYAAQRQAAALCDELGDGGAEITRLVPQLTQICPDMAVAPVLEHEASRFNLFDSLVGFLRRAADARPLLMVIDDLHWADMPSLQLLRFAAIELRDSRLLIVGTYRDVEVLPKGPLSQFLRELTGPIQQIALQGLSLTEVGQLMTHLSGVNVSASAATAVHARTNGNPFFVRELARLPAALAGDIDAVPIAVRGVIEERADRLTSACRSLLQAASVIGLEFELGLLSDVAHVSVSETTERLREAASARLVEMTDEAVRFVHGLVRETLYLSVEPSRRRSLHRYVATTMERRHAGALGDYLAQLADHFRQAGEDGDLSRALEYAIRASDRSMDVFAYEHAAAQLELALHTLALVAPGQREKAAKLHLALSRAQVAVGNRPAGRSAMEHASRIARELGDGTLLTEAALTFGDVVSITVDDAELRLLSEALTSLGTQDSALRARLLARSARALLLTPQVDRRIRLAEEAVSTARRLNDPSTLAAVLCDCLIAARPADAPESQLAMADEAVDVAERCGDRATLWIGRTLRLGLLIEIGDQERLVAELDAHTRLLHERRQLQDLWMASGVRATLAYLAGSFAEAEGLADEALRLGQRFQHPHVAIAYEAILSCMRLMQGRLSESVDRLEQFIQAFPTLPIFSHRLTLIIALWDAGRHDEARTLLERFVAKGFVDLPRDFMFVANLALLAIACDRQDASQPARALYEMLIPYAPYNARGTRSGSLCFGSVQHYLGLLAATLGQWDDAVSHLEEAIVANTRQGFLAAAIHSRYRLGRALVQRGREGDRHRGRCLTAEAQAAAARHGIRLTPGPGHASRMPGTNHPLSARELQIGELVAQGLSNQEIARRLFISKRTAETHVDHIKNKLGLATRAQLVAWVLRRPERDRRDS
jgi:DNA-binding CsgD family transcriptional regulator/tetratricopeptide (TPR) repeat protein